MNHIFHGFEPFKGEIPKRQRGSMVAWEDGEAVTYGLYNAQERVRCSSRPAQRYMKA